MEFDVFLSHNSKDKPAVRELKRLLEAHKLRSWLDADELIPGENWQPGLVKGIMNCESMAVCIGSAGVGPWEDEEMQGAMTLAVSEKRRVIPVVLPGAPEKPEISLFLSSRTWVDLRRGFTEEGVARVVWGVTGHKPARLESSPQPTDTSTGQTGKGVFSHAPERLIGRETELDALDQAWNNPSTRVLTIVAWGGVGKTSLVAGWMISRDVWNRADFERVFDWSFFSQGTREHGGASADTFVAAALKFFGDEAMAQSAASPWEKGARLAKLVAERRTLLVLDGVEPLQYPPGPLAGELKDPALATLLKGLAQRNGGLCIVTTRERVTDLAPFRDTTSPEWQLQHLSTPAGVELLKTLGVRGTATEFHSLVEDVKGHALTINLIGRYLAKAHQGDIRKRDQVEFEKADAKIQGGYAFKTIGAYEKWLTEGGEDGARSIAVLRLLGLFDRPADAGCISALRREPAIVDLTEPLIGLADDDWNIAVASLEECGLVSRIGGNQLGSSNANLESALDAHPLLREYFGKQLREDSLDAWRAAHQRLYEHLCATTQDKPQATLEDLQPLYQAVTHGCQAGLQQEAREKVYRDRILRGTGLEGFYSTRKLGAFGANLGAIACFFEQPWSHLSPSLPEDAQGWLLNEAATHLSALGRLTEALEPMRLNLRMRVQAEEWQHAPSSASNLSEMELTLGEVAVAVEDAEQSVTYADRSGDAFERMASRTTLADALHQAGRRAEAEERFREAEIMQAERQPEYPLLYSLAGFQYCDLLLAASERAAWTRRVPFTPPQLSSDQVAPNDPAGGSATSAALQSWRAVSQRATKMFEWRVRSDTLLDIALDHLILGRAAHYASILESANAQLSTAISNITSALDGLRRASQQHYLPLGLLSRAWLRFLTGARTGPESAQTDLDEAWEIAERGPMKLFMADIHLYRARLFHSVKPYPWTSPQDDLAAARKLIEQCGYWRRKEELEDAEEAAKNW